MPSNIQCWLEKVYKSRLITTGLRNDLLHIHKQYTRMSKCKYELYNLRKEVNLEYVSIAMTMKQERNLKRRRRSII